MINVIRTSCTFFCMLSPLVGIFLWREYGIQWALPAYFSIVSMLACLPEAEHFDLKLNNAKHFEVESVMFRAANRICLFVFIYSIYFWIDHGVTSTEENSTAWAAINIATSVIIASQFVHELAHSRIKVDRYFSDAFSLILCFQHYKKEHEKHHSDKIFCPVFNESIYSFTSRNYFRGLIKRLDLHGGLSWDNLMSTSVSPAVVNYSCVVLLMTAFNFQLGILAALLFCIVPLTFLFWVHGLYYISHYGLGYRKMFTSGVVAWDAASVIDRLLMGNSGRHTEHHLNPDLPSYLLGRKRQGYARLPASYPLMLMLALVPRLWFFVMNERLEAVLLIGGVTESGGWLNEDV